MRALALAFAVGCAGPVGPLPFDPGEGPCRDASERLGYIACVHVLESWEAWREISVEVASIDQLRVAKHLIPEPGTDTALIPLVANANAFELHSEFLRVAFPDEFPTMDQEEYQDLVLGVDRPFMSGDLIEMVDGTWTFFIWDRPDVVAETATLEEVTLAWEGLSPLVEALSGGSLAFLPNTANQLAAAKTWTDAPFPIRGVDTGVVYEAYTQGAGFGTVRMVDVADLDALSAEGAFGWQDLLVLDEAPFDLERVVSGIVTGSRQTGLSHLNVRSAARGTPNCFVAHAQEALAEWEGQLVRLECAANGLSVRAAEPAEADAFWEELRPEPTTIPAPDLETRDMPGLLDLPTGSAADRAAGLAAYGSKGANLAVLYQRIDPRLQLEGMLVPMSAYADFMEASSWTVDLGEGPNRYSFAETLDAWMADEDFLTDYATRRAALESLREAMQEAPVDPAFLMSLSELIGERWGDDTLMVRLRSSSNAEDALTFSGAGLYESESACLADEWDGDDSGPSRCDPDKSKERTLSDALRTVWSSLWLPGAWEERAWYGMDQAQVGMAILVVDRVDDEQAEAVAFSGDPVEEDDRVRIDAQIGSVGVVSPESGVIPELIRVTVADGVVEEIEVEQASSEADAVLTHALARRIAVLVASLPEILPIDLEVPDGSTLLFDTEWDVHADGQPTIKQVRPFLRVAD